MQDQFPSEDEITPEKTSEINRRVSALAKASYEPINIVSSAIGKAKRHASLRYLYLFSFGSALLCVAKIIEWMGESDLKAGQLAGDGAAPVKSHSADSETASKADAASSGPTSRVIPKTASQSHGAAQQEQE